MTANSWSCVLFYISNYSQWICHIDTYIVDVPLMFLNSELNIMYSKQWLILSTANVAVAIIHHELAYQHWTTSRHGIGGGKHSSWIHSVRGLSGLGVFMVIRHFFIRWIFPPMPTESTDRFVTHGDETRAAPNTRLEYYCSVTYSYCVNIPCWLFSINNFKTLMRLLFWIM